MSKSTVLLFMILPALLCLPLAAQNFPNLDTREIPYPDSFPPKTDPRVTITGDGTSSSPREMVFTDAANDYMEAYMVIRERYYELYPGVKEIERQRVFWLKLEKQLKPPLGYENVDIDGKESQKVTTFLLDANGVRTGTINEKFREWDCESEVDDPVLQTVKIVQQNYVLAEGTVILPDGTQGTADIWSITSTSPSIENPDTQRTRLQMIFKFSFDVDGWTLDRRVNGLDGDPLFSTNDAEQWFIEGEEEMQDFIWSPPFIIVPPFLSDLPSMPYFDGLNFWDSSAFTHSMAMFLWLPTGNEVDISFGYTPTYYAFRLPADIYSLSRSLCCLLPSPFDTLGRSDRAMTQTSWRQFHE